MCLAEAIRRLGAGPVSLIGTLGPVITIFLGWMILAEPIGLFQLLGGALVVAGVVLVVSGERRASATAQSPPAPATHTSGPPVYHNPFRLAVTPGPRDDQSVPS